MQSQRKVGLGRPPVRWIGILGILATVVTGSAEAMDENRPCLDLLEENGGMDDSLAEQPLLTGNQCEALKTRELRALFLEIPQEDEDPLQLSLGIKNGGGMLRLKIPFSF
jgi:hypothetical protein